MSARGRLRAKLAFRGGLLRVEERLVEKLDGVGVVVFLLALVVAKLLELNLRETVEECIIVLAREFCFLRQNVTHKEAKSTSSIIFV